MFTRSMISACLLLLLRQPALGDCGSIPFKPGTEIFEPNQRAIITFNGRRELLLLSTDLRASKPTKVLEVIPFPSEPTVSKGSLESFERATRFINRRLGVQGSGGGSGGKAKPRKSRPPAGELTFHKQIGAHDVSVTRVVRPSGFIQWVEDYLRKQGVDQPKIPSALQKVIQEYLDDKFHWFAFNVVDLGVATVTKDAVRYQFKTRKLYYPLRITRAETGSTKIQLILITERLVKIPKLSPAEVRVLHTPLKISKQDIRRIDKDIDTQISGAGLIRIWEIEGELAAFQDDLLTN